MQEKSGVRIAKARERISFIVDNVCLFFQELQPRRREQQSIHFESQGIRSRPKSQKHVDVSS